eukprot:6190028-Pleurochrysis_carterae.AAC.6
MQSRASRCLGFSMRAAGRRTNMLFSTLSPFYNSLVCISIVVHAFEYLRFVPGMSHPSCSSCVPTSAACDAVLRGMHSSARLVLLCAVPPRLCAGDGRTDFIHEDVDGDGVLDLVHEDVDGDGVMDVIHEDVDGDGVADLVHEDVDRDGRFDVVHEDTDGAHALARVAHLLIRVARIGSGLLMPAQFSSRSTSCCMKLAWPCAVLCTCPKRGLCLQHVLNIDRVAIPEKRG